MRKFWTIVAVLALSCALAAQAAESSGVSASASAAATSDGDTNVIVNKQDGQTTVTIRQDGEVYTFAGNYSDEEIKQMLREHGVDYIVLNADALLAQVEDDEYEEQLRKMRVRVGSSSDEGVVYVSTADGDDEEEDGEGMERPYMGVYFEDMTLAKARSLNYNENYGILITGVVPDSPARLYRILSDDIIMEIDGQKVWDKKTFSKIIDAHYVGDTVPIKLFRNGEEQTINFVFGSRKQTVVVDVETGEPVKHRLNPGNGGGGWIPVWFTPDVDDINDIVTRMGFSEIDDKGIFMNGLGGKGNVGNGWMLGGMGCWYTLDRKIDNPSTTPNTIRRMEYHVGYGGVTLDKRIPLSRKFITSAGFMLGWGGWSLEVNQTDGDYDWKTLPNSMNSSVNNHMEISKNYIFVQPKVMAMYRIMDWLAIRAEVGYIASYSFYSGWKANVVDEDFEIPNSPDTSFDGMTFTIGPWFGF